MHDSLANVFLWKSQHPFKITHFSFYLLIKNHLPHYLWGLHAFLCAQRWCTRDTVFSLRHNLLSLTVCRAVHQHQRLLPERLNVLQHAGKLRGNQKWWGDNRLTETLTGVEESNKKTWKVWWNEKRRGELHHIVITCTHTDSLVQSKRDFSRDKLSPAGFILCAWSVSVCTNREEGRCKVESADRKLKHCESSCYYVLGADLWSGCLQCAPWKHLWSPNISSVREAWECQATLLASSP